MAAQNRLAELMALTAPNTSGVDARAVIPALAASGLTPATTYSYGMGVNEVAKESQLGMQHLDAMRNTVDTAANRALSQDAQLKEQAARAHSMLMSEKSHALQQQVHADNMRMAERNFQFNLDKFEYQKLVEGERLAMDKKARELEMEATKYAAQKSQLELTLLQDRVDTWGKLKNMTIPVTLSDGSTKNMSVGVLTAMGVNLKDVLPSSKDPEMQAYAANRQKYLKMGISPNSATYLAHMDLPKILTDIDKNLTTDINNKAKNVMTDNAFGTYETMENGKKVVKAHTAESYRTARMSQILTSLFADLPQADRDIMIQRLTSQIGPQPSEQDRNIEALADLLLQSLANTNAPK